MARQALLRVNSFRKPSAAILLYHRVETLPADPWNMAVSPRHFAEQMAVLKAWNRVVSLSEAVDWGARSRRKGCMLAVTFDDGYRDNLVNALPVLEKETIPATLYTTSGALGEPMAFWWDILVRIFLETPELPDVLELDLGDTAASWRLGPDAIRTPEALARAAAWDADNEKPRDLRQATLVEVWSFVAGLPRERRREAVSRILDWAGNPTVAAEGDIGAPLTAEELAKLAASPLIDIGGHTESHCDLSRTPAPRAAEEITRDRDTLRDITGQPVDHFAHPYGRRGPDTREHLRSAGYVTATTSGSGVSNPLHDPYWLPRIQTPDIGGEEFERLISWMTGLPRPRRSCG